MSYDEDNYGPFDDDIADVIEDYDVDNIDDPREKILLETLSEHEDEDSVIEEEEEEDEEEEPDGIIETPVIHKSVKQDVKYIPKEQRKTHNFMTVFEYTRLIGERAAQIESNEPVHPEITKKYPNVDNALDLAELEINDIKIPFPIIIERPINIFEGSLYVETWDVRELILPKDQLVYGLN